MKPPPPDVLRLTALVKTLNGHLVVYIPMAEGGNQLGRVTKGLSDIEGTFLKIVLPTWLAEEYAIVAGCQITIDNHDGQFNIRRINSVK